ncbi:hypothetical protein BDA99DRAFT_519307 [Phascolomyces articulosus]|uniref:NADH:flavin oxidoreductase/NADH oxidase N-terminal domain-containing protein n=1 Tax=Phascolomyces articulosus TaxID=60185 RepID=A0AAD5K3Z3_9FUNG|nr:hypothetical protein BDA99DRAFT_519307 [Phascolomyces articulosus]
MSGSTAALFQPAKVGPYELKHRVVLAPLTRLRCDSEGVPTELVSEYYKQRTTEGGLILTEATGVSGGAGIYPGGPGVFTDKQIEGWKKVVQTIHDNGGIVFSQLWHAGRATSKDFKEDKSQIFSASAVAIKDTCVFTGKLYEEPRAMTVEEIQQVVQEFAQAAKNAIAAGFDGVEIHGANGYLLDQFINTSSNFRTDEYGGSIENRARFLLETTAATVEAIGVERVAVRLSPWSEFQDMEDETPYETWGYIVSELKKRHPKLAYIHFIEPRDDYGRKTQNDTVNTLDPFREKWGGQFISAGGYTTKPELAAEICEQTGNLIAIGRAFIANPDIVYRLKNGIPMNKYDRNTFYCPGAAGYTDYKKYDEDVKA